jgi:hypothetical protein
LAQPHRQPRVRQSAAQRALLQPHLRGDVPAGVGLTIEGAGGPEGHAAGLHLDQQQVTGLVGHHHVDLAVAFGLARTAALRRAVEGGEGVGLSGGQAVRDEVIEMITNRWRNQ